MGLGFTSIPRIAAAPGLCRGEQALLLGISGAEILQLYRVLPPQVSGGCHAHSPQQSLELQGVYKALAGCIVIEDYKRAVGETVYMLDAFSPLSQFGFRVKVIVLAIPNRCPVIGAHRVLWISAVQPYVADAGS